jgi:hypothetical protein
MKTLKDKIKEAVEVENYGFDTEKIISVIENYSDNGKYKGKWIYSQAIARQTKLDRIITDHILCELRDAGVLNECFYIVCDVCSHSYGDFFFQEDIKVMLEDFECHTCESNRGHIRPAYQFKEEGKKKK